MRDDAGVQATLADESQATARDAGSLSGYEVGEVIGRGGMGEVLAARDVRIDREVAIKRMRGDQPSPELVARFLREARIQARLDHPAIVPVHELGSDEHGQPYFTMKRLAGTTLAHRLATGETQQRMLRAFGDVCSAIAFAHARRIVHRDLKPTNIMIGEFGEVYVLDWGVARDLAEAPGPAPVEHGESEPGRTVAGALLGTPGYMAPEQVRGETIGTAADVYALGAILFEILAGEPLHPSGGGALASTLEKPTASPAARRPDRAVPPELDGLCVAALAEDPAARPAARELAEQIEQYLDGDRDLARRRALARDQIALAREAIGSGDPSRRAAAAQAAGRALALDPESDEAAQLVAQVILEPPRELPGELAAALDEDERALNRERSRRAIPAFLGILMWLAITPWLEVTSWLRVALVVGACLGMATLSYASYRTGRVRPWALLLGNFIVAVAFSQLAGPFLLMPMLACGQILVLTTSSWLDERPAVVIAWMLATLLAPFALAAIGLVPPTWHIGADGLLLGGAATRFQGRLDLYLLIFGQAVLGTVIGVYAMSIARARRKAQRAASIQAWHLQRMILPRSTTRLP